MGSPGRYGGSGGRWLLSIALALAASIALALATLATLAAAAAPSAIFCVVALSFTVALTAAVTQRPLGTASGGWRRSDGSTAARPVCGHPECGHRDDRDDREGIETIVIDHVQRLGRLHISDLDATVFEPD